MCCAMVFSRSCLQPCIPFPLGSPPCSPCCEDKVCPSSCWAQAAVLSALFANKAASLQGLLPCMRPAAQARAASGLSRSAQGHWHSLNFREAASGCLSGCLGKACPGVPNTAAFTDCSCVARTCRTRLGSCCTNPSVPTKQPYIVLAPQLKHQTRQRLWV